MLGEDGVMKFVPPAKILIASDIFGMTEAFLRLARSLGPEPVPLCAHEDQALSFESEAEAYERFMQTGGIDAYVRRLRAALAADPAITALVGFSAGATAGWIACGSVEAHRLGAAVLFYGSRIRDHAALQPACPVRLIFAEYEAGFDPGPLVQGLAARGIPAELVQGAGHGFMNELSAKYSPLLHRRFLGELRRLMAAPGQG